MAKIRVLIADDHTVLRTGLRLLINSQPDMEVVGEAGSFADTLAIVPTARPHVVTLDLSMPGGTGVKLIERLTREFPQARVLVLTMHDDPAYFRTALAAGAAGYLVKVSADTELLTAIRCVAAGRTYAHVESAGTSSDERLLGVMAARSSDQATPLDSLSEREREVLLLIARGHTNQSIADQLFLSVKTIESYRSRLMTKLGLRNRAELFKLASESGLLGPDAT